MLTHVTCPDSGHQFKLGNRDEPIKGSWTIFGDTPQTPVIPRSEWDAIIASLPPGPDDPTLPPVHNQDGIGMCNPSATAAAIEAARAAEGLPYVSLSGGDLYHRISGGSDNGSTLEDGLAEAMAGGVASVAVVPYLDWRGNHGQAAVDDRARFRVLEAYLCPTFDHVFSAVAGGFKLISGIMWRDGYHPDQDGWLTGATGGQGGHAVFGYKPAKRGSTYGIWHQNSWTATWGPFAGRVVFPEVVYGRSIGGWWAVRGTTQEESGIPQPKFA